MLQCVAASCSELGVHWSCRGVGAFSRQTLQGLPGAMLQCGTVNYSVLQRVAASCEAQCVTTHSHVEVLMPSLAKHYKACLVHYCSEK